MEKVDALRSSSLLSALEEDQLASLAGIAQERSLAAGETLIRAGDTGALAMYVILEGSMEVSKDGNRLSLLGPGQHIGEMALLAPDNAPRSADVVAMEPTRILQLASWDLFPFLDTNPNLARAIITELARRLIQADERLSAALAKDS